MICTRDSLLHAATEGLIACTYFDCFKHYCIQIYANAGKLGESLCYGSTKYDRLLSQPTKAYTLVHSKQYNHSYRPYRKGFCGS